MIYQSGTTDGFTLLEVLVAVVIFAVAFTTLYAIQTNYIKEYSQNQLQLQALQFLKKYQLDKSRYSNHPYFKVEEKTNLYILDIKRTVYTVIHRKTGREILTVEEFHK